MFIKSSRLGLFYKPPALNSVPLFRETRTPFATPLGAEPLAGARGGWLALAWETATGRGLSGRADRTPCASLRSLPARLPPRCPALLPGHEKGPRIFPGAAIADGRAVRGIAAPFAEIPGRPSFERSCHPRRGPNGRVGAQALRRHCITRGGAAPPPRPCRASPAGAQSARASPRPTSRPGRPDGHPSRIPAPPTPRW